jgi:gamma-glutamyl-gamma-aminobutyrate hydrolase PuuD
VKRRPLIGIGCNLLREEDGDTYYNLDRAYVKSVLQAGGTPILMPFFRTAAEARAFLGRLDGVVFTGGRDISPARWRERRHPKTKTLHPERESSDFLALRGALARDMPLLAVCCGCQELNVALGGSLHQHIDDLPGVRKHTEGARHPVELASGSRLREIVGAPRPTVNSYHHQACRDLGRGLSLVASSPDGLVEGIESARHRFAVGVQWHPEAMPGDPRQQALFRALVAESRK